MMNTKKIAALSLLVIFGIGQVSAKNPFKIAEAHVETVLTKLVDDIKVFNKAKKSELDPAKVKTACENIATFVEKDHKDLNKLDLGNKIKSKDDDVELDADDLNLVYAYLGRNGRSSGSSSSDGYGNMALGLAGVAGLAIGGVATYFFLSGNNSGGSDE